MPANVTYPQMIAAFKLWYGQNKTRPSPTVEIDGQPAVRKASFGEMVQAGLTQLAAQAALGGFEFLKGGPEGLDKFLSTLPKEIAEPAKALAESAGTAVNNFKETVNGLIPEGGNVGQFVNLAETSLQTIKETFINPIADTLDVAKAAFNGDLSKLQELQSLYANDNSLAGLFTQGAATLGTTVTTAIDGAKQWSNELTIGDNISLSDVFSAVNNSSTKVFAEVLGIGEVPTLTDLAGTLVKDDLMENLMKSKEKEQKAQENLRKAAALAYPTIPDEFGQPVDNPEIAALGLNTLSQSEKDAILANLQLYKDEFSEAVNDVAAAGQAISLQVQSDQKTMLTVMQAQNVVDSYGNAANNLNSVTDPAQKALLERTINPNIKNVALQLAPVLQRAENPQQGSLPPVAG